MREALASLPGVGQKEVDFGAEVLCEIGSTCQVQNESKQRTVSSIPVTYDDNTTTQQASYLSDVVSMGHDALDLLDQLVASSERLVNRHSLSDRGMREMRILHAEATIQVAAIANRPDVVVDQLRLLAEYHHDDVEQEFRSYTKGLTTRSELLRRKRASLEVDIWLGSSETNREGLISSLIQLVELDEQIVAFYQRTEERLGRKDNEKIARKLLQLSWSRHRLTTTQQRGVHFIEFIARDSQLGDHVIGCIQPNRPH